MPDMMVPRSKPKPGAGMGSCHCWLPGHMVEVLQMSSNTLEEVGEMSTSRSAWSSGVVTSYSLVEEVRVEVEKVMIANL